MKSEDPLYEEDINFEIEFYEGILKKRKDFLQALIALGDLYTRKGMIEKGLLIDKKLSKLRPENPIILYNLACSYSLCDKVELAYSTIKLAVKCGYNDFEFMENDSDLANLHKVTKFKGFLTRIKKKAKKSDKQLND